MAIIYIHGVKVRSDEHGKRLKASFTRWLAPKLSVRGAEPLYLPVYWGDAAASFRWDLESRPKTQLFRQGGDEAFAGLGSLRDASRNAPFDQDAMGAVTSGPVLGAAVVSTRREAPPLSGIPAERRADFISDFYLAVRPRQSTEDPITKEPELAALADAAADVAAQWVRIIDSTRTEDERAAQLLQEVEKRLYPDDLVQQGGFRDWMSRAGETLKRATFWPGDAISTVFAELRPVAHEFLAHFVGDVIVYVNERETESGLGRIPQRVLTALQQAHDHKKNTGERIVVVTHSMGGQLFYDAVTHYAPRIPALQELRVDHWISCGAQVSLFAELGVFKGQGDTRKPQKLPRPASVAAWTNYYDRNDLVGFIMSPVFEGVTDEEYNTGYGLAFAHTGFLARPSFFERVAARI